MPWNGSNVYRVVGRLILLIFIYLEVQLYNEIRSKRYATFIILLASWNDGFGTKVVYYKSLHDHTLLQVFWAKHESFKNIDIPYTIYSWVL